MPLLFERMTRLILTSGTPCWRMLFGLCKALFYWLCKQVCGFVGIRSIWVTHFMGSSHAGPKQIEHWTRLAVDPGQAAA